MVASAQRHAINQFIKNINNTSHSLRPLIAYFQENVSLFVNLGYEVMFIDQLDCAVTSFELECKFK